MPNTKKTNLPKGRQPGSKNRTPVEKLEANPNSLRLSVNAQCWQCQGEDADPCVQWRIGNCEIPKCAIYAVRPYQQKEGEPLPHSLKWMDRE